MKRFGILTGGGDCPGLNAAIRAVTRRSLDLGSEVVGIENGWKGLVEGTTRELSRQRISGILPRGGTIIGTARTNPYKLEGGVDKVTAQHDRARAGWAGGDRRRGHARGRNAAGDQEHGLPVVGVPKTIDNDLLGDRLHHRLRHGGRDLPRRRSIDCTRRRSRTTA